MNGVFLQDLSFAESDRDNLNLILNNIQPKNKIDFLLVSDNRKAADLDRILRKEKCCTLLNVNLERV